MSGGRNQLGTAGLWLATACAVVGPSWTAAVPPDLLAFLPDDPILAYLTTGPEAAEVSHPWGSMGGLAAMAIDQARQMGLLSGLSDRSRAWLDAVAAAFELFSYPHAFVLIDVSARARPDGGHELDNARLALVLQTQGASQRIDARIQHLLNRYANSENSTLRRETIDRTTVHSLADRRLPEWAVISWGEVGGRYVIALGEDAFQSLLAGPAASAADRPARSWMKSTLAARNTTETCFAGYVNISRLRRDTRDPAFSRKVEYVQYELGLAGAEAVLLTIAERDRVVEIDATAQRRQGDRVWRLAGAVPPDAAYAPGVPEGASRYAAVHLEPVAVYRGVRNALYASRSAHKRERWRALGDELAAKAGVRLEQDLLEHLKAPVLIHNFPPHALSLPVACTIVARVDSDHARFRAALDRLLEAARGMLPDGSGLTWERAPDGVWYLRFGIVGPAITVADSWLVVSFSPAAARENAAWLARTQRMGHANPSVGP